VPPIGTAFTGKIRQAAKFISPAWSNRGRRHRYPHAHVPTAQIAVWDAEIAGRACVINPMLRLDHIVR
jgi:hypothetical protein